MTRKMDVKQYLTAWAARYKDDLTTNILPFWLTHGLDRQHGGIYTCLDRDGTLMDPTKSVWFQGRFAFVCAFAYNNVEQRPEWLEAARRTLDFIDAHCYDTDGRMYFEVAADGTPLRKRRYVFSETFAIIAMAEASSNLARFDGVKYGYRSMEGTDLHDMYKKTRAEGFGKEAKKRILLGSFVLSSGYYDAYYLKALKTKALIKKAFDEAFVKYDVLLAPASPSPAPHLGESLTDSLKMYLSDIYTVAVNLAGLPAISMPWTLDSQKLPVGLQFIGNCFEEKKVLQAAMGLEKIRGDFPLAFAKEEG